MVQSEATAYPVPWLSFRRHTRRLCAPTAHLSEQQFPISRHKNPPATRHFTQTPAPIMHPLLILALPQKPAKASYPHEPVTCAPENLSDECYICKDTFFDNVGCNPIRLACGHVIGHECFYERSIAIPKSARTGITPYHLYLHEMRRTGQHQSSKYHSSCLGWVPSSAW
jgi:hypothetical protein